MSSIDKRVVEAQFDNRQFQQGVKSTLNSLNSLKSGLNLDGATKGLDNVASATGRVAHGFSVMRIAAYTAVATVARQLTFAAENFVKAFTVAPLAQGLSIYETKLNSIQTVLANTGLHGAAGLAKVNGALAQLNQYSNQTIYNFSEMARNIGTFTAAGIKLHPAVESIKGIANLAAISGSSAQQASTAMYQLSQALASGRVKLQDWNSVVNAGMGGKVFQNALMETARVHGVAIDKMVKKDGSFRQTLQRGWLTSGILSQTLQQFTGDMNKAQLKAYGYTDKQIKAIQKMAAVATDAATKVKTLPQLLDVLKESVATGWATTWETLIGNLSQAKKLFTGVNNAVGGWITRSAEARNKILGDWKALGGRTVLINAIKDAFHELGAILKPIHDAFREIFPKQTGQTLYDMTVAFKNFIDKFKIGAETANNLKRTFAGLFAVFDIGWQIIKELIRFLANLFEGASKGSGGVLKATASLGDFLVKIDNMLKKGDGIRKFFDAISNLPFITFLGQVISHFYNVTSTVALLGPALNKTLSILQQIGKVLKPIADSMKNFFANLFGHVSLANALQVFNLAFIGGIVVLIKKMIDKFTGGGDGGTTGLFKGLIDSITQPFKDLTTTLQSMQQSLRVATLMEIAIAVGILTASVLVLSKIDSVALTKALTALAGMFTELMGSLYLFAKVGGAKGLFSTSAGLILFATAIRILTSSVKALAGLSWGQLAKGLTGVAILIGSLVAASRGLATQAGGMIRTGAGLVILAEAIKLLVTSVTSLSGLSWGQMAKGLTGIATILTALALFTKIADVDKMGILNGAGLVLLATALQLMARAVSSFAKESWGQLSKGVASIGVVLAELAIFSNTVGNPATLLASGAALIGIGIAMNILAHAVSQFAKLSWGQIAKGLVSMAGALAIIVLALNTIPPTSVLGAAALVGVSLALVGIGHALKNMGGMSWGEIARGLVALAGSLIVIAGAMALMTGALPGAAALMVVSAALALLVPELKVLGGMSWSSIAKALITLAGAFVVIGVAGLALTPVIPSLLGLGAAILLLGAGVAAIGGGVFLFSTGLTALATSGAAAASALQLIFNTVVGFIPTLVKALALVLVQLAKVLAVAAPQLLKTAVILIDTLLKAIAKEGPRIIDTFGNLLIKLSSKLADTVPKMTNNALKMFLGILQALDRQAPKIVSAMSRLMVDLLNELAKHTGQLVTAGMNVIVHFLEGIAKNVSKVAKAGADIIIAWIKAIGKQSLRIINAAMDTIVTFINGLAAAIRKHTPELRKAGWNLAKAIADGMTLGLASKTGDVAKGAENLAKSAYGAAKSWLKSLSPSKKFMELGAWGGLGFVMGLNQYAKASSDAGKNLADNALQGASKEFKAAAKYIMNDLPKDLVGGKDQVKQAIQNTSQLLHQAVQQSHQDMQQAQQDLKSLTQGRKDDARAVRDAAQAVSDAKQKLDDLIKSGKANENQINAAKNAVSDAEARLKSATKTQKEHEQAIKDDTAALAHSTDEHNKAKAALDEFNKEMDAHKAKLIELGKQYDAYTQKINDAQQALDAAIQTEKSYQDQITQQYSALPDISPDESVADFTGNLQDQVDNTQKYIDDLNTLRDQFGLSDALYQELLSKGPAILPFVEQLVSGGQDAVDQLNALTAQLDTEAAGLGDVASKSLYQAGVDAAQGLLDGLKKKQKDIEKHMQHIADQMEKKLKERLGIKSPSTVMADVGTQMMDGLGQGIQNSQHKLIQIVEGVGQRLVNTMKKYVDQMNSLVASVDTSSLTPVIDTTKVTTPKVTAPKLTAPKIATDSAKAISISFGALSTFKDTVPAVNTAPASLTFNQYNTSPKALSSAEIYRQTNNQISTAKGALTK